MGSEASGRHLGAVEKAAEPSAGGEKNITTVSVLAWRIEVQRLMRGSSVIVTSCLRTCMRLGDQAFFLIQRILRWAFGPQSISSNLGARFSILAPVAVPPPQQ